MRSAPLSFLSAREAAEAEAVREDEEAARAHGGRGEDRREKRAEERVEGAGCNGDKEDVIAVGPEEVLADGAEHATRETDRRDEGREIAAHEDDVAGLDRDVGAAADRDADVGLSEGGRI